MQARKEEVRAMSPPSRGSVLRLCPYAVEAHTERSVDFLEARGQRGWPLARPLTFFSDSIFSTLVHSDAFTAHPH